MVRTDAAFALLRGRVEVGKSGGGNSYGYDVIKSFDAAGALVRGNRCINEGQAAIVRRIFSEYASGLSSRTIAKKLNREGIPGPSGKGWGPSTIHGNRERGTGILNNELYIGRLVWNRLRYIKDPDTGRRVSRPNPEAALIVKDVPEMRLLDQELWDKVKARQRSLSFKQNEAAAEGRKASGFWDRKRPRSLFSGLLKCGECGGGITLINRNYLGCATARNKGCCDHLSAIRRDVLEETVLSGLQHRLMDPVLTEAFCAEYAKHANRLRQNIISEQDAYRAELGKITCDQQRLVDAIMSGVPAAKIKERMELLEARQKELTALLAAAATPAPVFLHPKMSERYRAAVGRLREALNDTARRPEAVEIIRALVDFITLSPRKGAGAKIYEIEIEGDLAEILRLAARQPPHARAETQQIQQSIKLVAGAGFEPTTFRL